MQEIYYLNRETLPTIPVPHDCIIEDIVIENQYIIFKFEADLSRYDSIKHIKPNVKSLVIKFHLCDECFNLYKWHKPIKFIAKNGFYKCIDGSKLLTLTSGEYHLQYIYHHIAYRSIIIEMWSGTPIRLEISADYIEFDWEI